MHPSEGPWKFHALTIITNLIQRQSSFQLLVWPFSAGSKAKIAEVSYREVVTDPQELRSIVGTDADPGGVDEGHDEIKDLLGTINIDDNVLDCWLQGATPLLAVEEILVPLHAWNTFSRL